MSRALKAVRKLAVGIFGGGAFQVEGATSSENLRWKHARCTEEQQGGQVGRAESARRKVVLDATRRGTLPGETDYTGSF